MYFFVAYHQYYNTITRKLLKIERIRRAFNKKKGKKKKNYILLLTDQSFLLHGLKLIPLHT